MKFHTSVIEEILRGCQNYGGHADEKKLREFLSPKRYAVYSGDRRDMVLVDAHRYLQECMQRRMPSNHIVPMTLHPTAFEKIIYLYDLYSGYQNESKLRNALAALDFTAYERKFGERDTILVLTEDYLKVLQSSTRAG
jgi:hypothetical protein